MKLILTIPDDADDILISLASTPDSTFVICPRNIANGKTVRYFLHQHFIYPQLSFMERRKARKRMKKANRSKPWINVYKSEYLNKPCKECKNG